MSTVVFYNIQFITLRMATTSTLNHTELKPSARFMYFALLLSLKRDDQLYYFTDEIEEYMEKDPKNFQISSRIAFEYRNYRCSLTNKRDPETYKRYLSLLEAQNVLVKRYLYDSDGNMYDAKLLQKQISELLDGMSNQFMKYVGSADISELKSLKLNKSSICMINLVICLTDLLPKLSNEMKKVLLICLANKLVEHEASVFRTLVHGALDKEYEKQYALMNGEHGWYYIGKTLFDATVFLGVTGFCMYYAYKGVRYAIS